MPHPRKEAAAEREKEKKATARAEAARKAEDSKWVDDGDKARKAREARLAERDAKADEVARKNREKADLLRAEEDEAMKNGKNKKLAPARMKQADIRLSALSGITIETKKSKAKKQVESDLVHDQPLVPNLNREASLEEARTGIKTEVGTGTVEAMSALSAALGDIKLDPHPEKRMKALHEAYEARRMKELQEEKPGLKRSQYKEMIFKEWLKSPENPMRTV